MKKIILYYTFLFICNGIIAQNNGIQKIPNLSNNFLSNELILNSDVAMDDNGDIWSTYGKIFARRQYRITSIGLAHYKNDSWRFYLPNTALTCLEIIGDTKWIGSTKGIIKMQGYDIDYLSTINNQFADDTIVDIKFRNNKLYVAMKNDIYSVVDGKVTHLFNKIDSPLFTCIDIAANGIIYAGSHNGLYKIIDKNSYIKYDSSNSALKSSYIYDVVVGKDQRVWIGGDVNVIFGNSALHVIDNGVLKSLYQYADYNGCQMNNGNLHSNSNIFRLFEKYDGSIVFIQNVKNIVRLFGLDMTLNSITGKTVTTRTLNFGYSPLDYVLTSLSQDKMLIFPAIGDSSLLFNIHNHSLVVIYNAQYLDINEQTVPIWPSHGIYHWDIGLNTHMSYPKNSCKNLIFCSSLWLSGRNGNDLYSSAGTYGQRGYDFFPGPIDTVLKQSTKLSGAAYDRIWKLNRTVIEDFKQNYSKPNYKIHPDILSWPAHGKNNASKYLAPFVDTDNNGTYEPQKGDYPLIKGDMCLFWIVNDTTTDFLNQTESGGKSMGVEVHCMAYGFNDKDVSPNDTNSLINRTTFYHYKIFNRSDRDYTNFRPAVYVDTDLGNFSDDYIGCSPKNNFGFSYNGDSLDEGEFGYGNNPPVLSIQMLDNNLERFMYYNNDASAICGNPTYDSDYYNYMNGNWKTGQKLRLHDKCSNGGTVPSNWMWPFDTVFSGQLPWTQKTDSIVPGDRRMLLSGDSQTLKAGAFTEFEYSIAVSNDIFTKPNWYQLLVADNQRIKNWYTNNSFPSSLDNNQLLSSKTNALRANLSIYPNPTEGLLNIALSQGMIKNFKMNSMSGKELLQQSVQSNEYSINLSNYPSGIYLLTIQTDSETSYHKVLVK